MGRDEKSLLEPCRAWLAPFLSSKYRSARITALEGTENRKLGAVLSKARFGSMFPEAAAWDVEVDVAAVIEKRKSCGLAFVEVKDTRITLRDVGQLLGYSRVCHPLLSFLLSPRGLSTELHRLLLVHGRLDVLKYDRTSICVGKLDRRSGGPDWGTVIPSGEFGRIGS